MNAILNVTTKIVAFADQSASSNPRLKVADWLRTIDGVAVSGLKSEVFSVPPVSSQLVFDGTRSTTIDGTTAFSLSLSPLDPSRYRIAATAGTAPGFRTARNLTLSGSSVTFAVNANATVTVTTTGTFAAVAVGDEVFIPHTTTGDAANVLSSINAGRWAVLGKASNTQIALQRLPGESFQGIAETVALTTNNQFVAFSNAGTQVGDHVDIVSGFALAARKTFEIIEVTDSFIEFVSTIPLAAETGITPGGGLSIYTNNKSFVYVESDQEVAVRVNGDTANYQRVVPADPSNPDSPGQYMRRGPTWSLNVVNLTTSTANVVVFHCE
jgi:hypothetical protein